MLQTLRARQKEVRSEARARMHDSHGRYFTGCYEPGIMLQVNRLPRATRQSRKSPIACLQVLLEKG